MDINQHLDMEALSELKEIMRDNYSLLINTFVVDSQQRIDDIEAAISNTDSSLIRSETHTLKGSAGNLAATHLAELCQQLIEKADIEDFAGCENLYMKLVEEFSTVSGLLKSTLE